MQSGTYGWQRSRVVFEYKASVLRVLDADTLHARVDLGFDARLDMTLRLAHIDAPEMSTPEGKEAKLFAVAWLAHNVDFRLESIKDRREKFGRYLAVVHPVDGGETLNDALLRTGHAVPYKG